MSEAERLIRNDPAIHEIGKLIGEAMSEFDWAELTGRMRGFVDPAQAETLLRTRIEAAFVPKEWRDCQVNAGRQLLAEATARAEAAEARVKVLEEALKPFAAVDLTGSGLPENFAVDVLRARAALGGEHE